MKLYSSQLQESFCAKSVLKVISRINNTNFNSVIRVAQSAYLSNATYLDVAANPKLIKTIKSEFDIPVCISSISPIDIYNCLSSGADIIELGNYDSFYKQGIYIGSDQLYRLVEEIRLLVGKVDICVTIPYHLSIHDQIELSKNLEQIGVNILQTEGIAKLNKIESQKINKHDLSFYNINKTFLPSLLSTHIISNSVNIPVISSSGCNNVIAPLSLLYGASGVGISSCLNKLITVTSMVQYINETYNSMLANTLERKINSSVSFS
uniref:Uncharacterized protein ycf23 n=1 Tax=Polysiphonia sertularioides TaxID=945028 RepID=A0A1Z1M966_9FLOR|nr:hypothetical protein [Polysiphonia sertularioides]ARW62442.1 hypothetical protein [Polysiphonia sertularioides]